jgi:hypothetical protein
MNIKPISPEEIAQQKSQVIPIQVIEIFNRQIAKNSQMDAALSIKMLRLLTLLDSWGKMSKVI